MLSVEGRVGQLWSSFFYWVRIKLQSVVGHVHKLEIDLVLESPVIDPRQSIVAYVQLDQILGEPEEATEKSISKRWNNNFQGQPNFQVMNLN